MNQHIPPRKDLFGMYPYRIVPAPSSTVEKGQDAITTVIHEFLGANRDPAVAPKQQKQHGEVGVDGERSYILLQLSNCCRVYVPGVLTSKDIPSAKRYLGKKIDHAWNWVQQR